MEDNGGDDVSGDTASSSEVGLLGHINVGDVLHEVVNKRARLTKDHSGPTEEVAFEPKIDKIEINVYLPCPRREGANGG